MKPEKHKVKQRKSIKIPEKLGDIAKLFVQLCREYGTNAVLDMDAGHNNINTEVVYEREETPEETRRREDAEEQRRVRRREGYLRRSEVCKRCGHARGYHPTQGGCFGHPEGDCTCTTFVERGRRR